MTGALDAKILPVAKKVIDQFGKSITLITETVGDYDPSIGKAAIINVSKKINGIIEEYKPFDIANGLAIAGDKKITIAAQGNPIPGLGDEITVDADTFKITQLQSIYSGEKIAVYVIQARKS